MWWTTASSWCISVLPPTILNISQKVAWCIEEIPDGAFMGCWGLEKINPPQGLKRIGKRAFDGTIIQKMNMPTTMEYIDDEAFVNTSLVEVNLRVAQPFELGENVLDR